MKSMEELRLITKVASLYYERKLRQSEIAGQLDLSQATVSRLLKRAEEEDVVRITVSAPMGVYPHLEEALQEKYGLKEVIIVDTAPDEAGLLRNLGTAGAYYLETTVRSDEYIGVSSWSETLLAMANAMHPMRRISGVHVVQILGGVGNPAAAAHAAQLTRSLAGLVQGEITTLPAPGVVGSKKTRQILLEDPYVIEAMACFGKISLALVGIGAIEPSPVLASSGNVFTEKELGGLHTQGAVGDICLRFFDAAGKPLVSTLNDRVIGMTLEQLRGVRRTVAIAGGDRKFTAIKGALNGGWVNVLITDHGVAEHILGS